MRRGRSFIAGAGAVAAVVVMLLAGCLAGQQSTLLGRVTATPGCGGPEPVDNPCPPLPVRGRVEARHNGVLASSTVTNADGHYDLRLLPGSYTLTVVTDTVPPRCADVLVLVNGGGNRITQDIPCDSGLR
jgi:hypothetical protein